MSSTETAMLATEDHFSETDNPFTAHEQYPTGITSRQQRFIHFILNERRRELLGELHRWEDLARTETLLLRAYAFNPDVVKAGTLLEKHTLRPIPQTLSRTASTATQTPHLRRTPRRAKPGILNTDFWL